MVPRKPGSVILVMLIALTVAACNVRAGGDAGDPPHRPEVSSRPAAVTGSALVSRWGTFVRWRIDGADWSIELPEKGWWDFANPLVRPGEAPSSATYRSGAPGDTDLNTYVYVDVVRLDRSALPAPVCAAPAVNNPDTGIGSAQIDNIKIDGHAATVTRLTAPARDGSTTGTFDFCFVTTDGMFQITAGGRPGSTETDLFAMVQTFRLERG